MTDTVLLLAVLILVVSFLYSSVGHGGASGYLALMVMFGISASVMRPSALILNLGVSGIAFFQFYRGGNFQWRLFWPFALASVPMAFLGAKIQIDPVLYKRILGLCLAVAAARIMNIVGEKRPDMRREVNIPVALIAGGGLGLLAGIIGIGGGIILSPLILLAGWGNARQTAAVSALFIFLNSAAGLAGMWKNGLQFYPPMYLWIIAAVAGGLAGAYAGSFRFSNPLIKKTLAVILFVAGIKLLIV